MDRKSNKKLNKKMMGVIVVIIIIILGFGAYWWFSDEDHKASLDSLTSSDRLALKTNIVVMGVDERDEDAGRSDTLFVVMLDTKENNASLLSIPRDTMVKIPEHGWDKINHAFAYGGYKLTQKTVEEFLGIRINHYVVIDFKGFKDLVDAMGGIDINVEKDMYYADPYDNLVIDLAQGEQHLNGEKAIEYVRYRDEEGDIGRIKRQQHFMAAVYKKVTSPEIILHLPSLLKEVISMVKTDIPLTGMVSLAKAMSAKVKEIGGMNMAMVPGEPVYIDEISYWVPDMTDLRALMVDMQGAKMNDKYKMAAERYEAEYKKILPDSEVEVKKDEKTDQEVKVLKKGALGKTGDADLEKLQNNNDKEKSEKLKGRSGQSDDSEQATLNGSSATQERTSKSSSTNTQRNVTVKIINCSGDGAKLAKAINMAENAGFIIVGTGEGSRSSVSQVVSTNTNGWIVSKLSTLPFSYSLRIAKNTEADSDGIIYIGEDFN